MHGVLLKNLASRAGAKAQHSPESGIFQSFLAFLRKAAAIRVLLTGTMEGCVVTGEVILINPKEKLAAIKTVNQRHSVVEVDGVDLGDELRWSEDYPFGTQVVLNQTKAKKIEAYFRIHGVARADLKRELLLP
jgi:hypothetical protein